MSSCFRALELLSIFIVRVLLWAFIHQVDTFVICNVFIIPTMLVHIKKVVTIVTFNVHFIFLIIDKTFMESHVYLTVFIGPLVVLLVIKLLLQEVLLLVIWQTIDVNVVEFIIVVPISVLDLVLHSFF